MRRKMLTFIFILILFIPSFNALPTIRKQETKFAVKTISFSHVWDNTSIDLDSILTSSNNNNSYYFQAGKSVIPVYKRTLILPFKTEIIDISCLPNRIIELDEWSPIISCPLPVSNNQRIPDFLKHFFSLIFSEKNQIPPTDWYNYRIGTGIKDQQRVLYVTIYVFPFRYHRNYDSIISTDEIEISIKYRQPLPQYQENIEFETLIISPKLFTDELQPLIQYRNKDSLKVKLITLSDLIAVGRDRQEDIKYCIKNAIEDFGITSVLLVGGYQQLPCRMVHVDDIRSVIMGEFGFISDLYYADIYDETGDFCSWDSNNNNRFGEFQLFHSTPSDNLDLYPDVYLSRFAGDSEEEIAIIVNKTIHYEQSFAKDSHWFQNIVAVGADTFTEDLIGVSEGEQITQNILDIMSGFHQEKLWGSNERLQCAEDISSKITNGTGFVCFEGHAGSNSFRTHPFEKRNEWIPIEWYRTYHIDKLTNAGKLPIVTINACNTCKFQLNHTSFCWSFLCNPSGGGIASLGMTCLSWIYPGIFCTRGLGGLIHQNAYRAYMNGANTFGEMWASSIISYLNENPWADSVYDYKTIESWQPFGDPDLILPRETQLSL